MDKRSKIKLMRRKKKLFPWLRTFCGKYCEKFFNTENAEIFEFLFFNVEKEIEDIYSGLNKEKLEDFFNILNSFFLHCWWQLRWKSCKKWKIFWKVKSTEVSKIDFHGKCCVQLLHYMTLLSIYLTDGDEESDWIGRILTTIKSLSDAVDIVCSALLLTSNLKKKHKPVYNIILKNTLCCEIVKNTTVPQTYFKVILLFRRLLKLTKDKKEKSQVFLFTSKLKVPCDIKNWLSSRNIEDYKGLNYENLTQDLLSRSYPDELLRKLSEQLLTEHRFGKRNSLKLDCVAAHNDSSNVTPKENVSKYVTKALNEDLLKSLVKTNVQNSLNNTRTDTSCIAEENSSDDISNIIKNENSTTEVSNSDEGMPGKINVNQCLKSLKKASENREFDNVKNKSNSHKKNKKKAEIKTNGEVELYSVLSVPASDIDVPSSVTSKENITKDLKRELDDDVPELLVKTNIQNDLNDIKRINDKDMNKKISDTMERISNEINVNNFSESLKKVSENQKLENEKDERHHHKEKKDMILKGSLKKDKKIKSKSKNKCDMTDVKIKEQFETCTKLDEFTLDNDVSHNITSKENISEDLNDELSEDFLESLVKINIQNGSNDACMTTENISNDINNGIKDKNLNNMISNPVEEICSKVVTLCSESLKKTSKKRKRENKESESVNHKKKKKDKNLKESSKKDKSLKKSKKHKKSKKKSKEKKDKAVVTVKEEKETSSKENVLENLNSELDEGLLKSLIKSNIQNGSNDACLATENTANDINNIIKNKDLNNVVTNQLEEKCSKNNAQCSELLKKVSKKRKLENKESERASHKKKKDKVENRESERASHKKKKKDKIENRESERASHKKKKKDKILNELSKKHKKSKKKSKEKNDKTVIKVNEDIETSSEENVLKNLNGELDDLLESLPNGIMTATSYIKSENTSNGINTMTTDLNKVVSNSIEEVWGETNLNHSSESLEKTSKKQKLENEESKQCSHKNNKENSKENSEKNKRFETDSKLNVSYIDESNMMKKDKEVKNSSKKSKSHKHKKKSEEKSDKTPSKTQSSVAISCIEKSHQFENPLDKIEISHEQQDYNLEVKKTKSENRKKSKSKNEKKEQNAIYSEPSLRKENEIDNPKVSSNVKMKKLFNNDLYCQTIFQEETQPSRTIANNFIVSTKLSPSKGDSLLNNDGLNFQFPYIDKDTFIDANESTDMPSNSNVSSCEDTTYFSDVSISELLKLQKINLYRNNTALGIESKPKSKSKIKQQLNSSDSNQKSELSKNSDLLMASKKILQESYISEPCKSPSTFDKDLGADETKNGNNQGNEIQTIIASQQSQFTKSEDTFFSMDCLSQQNCESIQMSEHSISSFSHSSLNPSIMLKDVFQCKSAQKYISVSEKSFMSVQESDNDTQSSTHFTNLEMNVSHELTLENIAKVNELYGENEGTLINYFCSDQKNNSSYKQNLSTLPIDNLNDHTELNKYQSPSLTQTPNNNILPNKLQSELSTDSVSQLLINASDKENQSDEYMTQYVTNENVNYNNSTQIINSENIEVHCNNDDSSNKVSSVQVIVNFTGNNDCSAMKKQQFVANFDFQTANNTTNTPIISSVFFNPVNPSTPMTNNIHNPNLNSMENNHLPHIIPFNQAPRFDNFNNSTTIFQKPEITGPYITLNNNGLTQTLCTTSSPIIVNDSNKTECNSQFPLNSDALNNYNKAFLNNSCCKNEVPLPQDTSFKHLTVENLNYRNKELNELPSEEEFIKNDSSYRSSTIYSDMSDDSIISSDNFVLDDFQTELSVGENLEVGISSKPASYRRNNFQVDSEPEYPVIIKSEPVKIDNKKSKKCSGLGKSMSIKSKTPKLNTKVKKNCNTKSQKGSKGNSLNNSTSTKEKTPEKYIPRVNDRYNLRVRTKAPQCIQL